MPSKQRLITLVFVCCVFALCLPLAGCFGAGSSKQLYEGTWTIASSTDKNIDDSTIALMRSMNSTIDLTLNEDETGTLSLVSGQTKNVTWKAKDSSEGTIVLDGQEMKLSLKDGKLSMTDSSNVTMTFIKKDSIGNAGSSVSSSASASSSAPASSSAKSTS